MQLHGHSKANLHYFEEDNGSFVIKYGSDRLNSQAVKQEIYRHRSIGSEFIVPKVIKKQKDCFVMPFYNGQTILDLISSGNVRKIDSIIESLFNFIRYEFRNSTKCIVTDCHFKEKLNYLKIKLDKSYVSDIIDSLLEMKFQVNWYSGYCHGDFTLDNMLFDEKIVLLDFLDVYLESPVQDLVKLRQSFEFRWELLINVSNYDYKKISIGYDYINKIMSAEYASVASEYDLSSFILNLVYLVTLLRIVPYTSNTGIYECLMKEIRGVYGKV